ncbi:MAG: hypothetical protein JF615_15370 [Asticcacaulis sp.]|nr:hypothetical protein [Asticcacaulis sp.]
MRIAILAGLVAGCAVIGAAAYAADKPLSCAEQWQKISTAAKPDKAMVKAYAAKCMAKSATAKSVSQADRMRQDRLGACDARWAQMKAANAIQDQTYEQFAAQCLDGAPRT